MKKERLKITSLFSGCGGKDLGFIGDFTFLGKRYEKLPYEVVWANDIDKNACETYKNNISNHIICEDIKEVKKNKIPQTEVVIGGFPCQDFSVAGKRLGTQSERGNLYLEMREVIKKKKPIFFIAENVSGILSIQNENGYVIEQIKSAFGKLGYNVKVWYLNAADYGVPQTRKRVFIVGTKKELKLEISPPPLPKHFLEPISAQEAIGDLERLSNHIPNHDQISKARRYGPNCQGNKPIKANKPSITIRAEHHGNIEYHYNDKRRLSVRECARLQSFPDNFIFHGATTYTYKQVGNAVPPVLAWHIAKHIYNCYEKSIQKKRPKSNNKNNGRHKKQRHEGRSIVRQGAVG